MTKDDIIKAAFKVWGRELYRTTSLTEIAQELGVSKAALYRHFKDKETLLEAMYPSFFDNCATFIKNGCEKAGNAASRQETCIMLMRTIAEYYILNKDAFIFSLVRVFNNLDRQNLAKEFLKRGINFEFMVREEAKDAPYPSMMQLIITTTILRIAISHRQSRETGELQTDETVKNVLNQIESRIKNGLNLDARKIAALDLETLERQVSGTAYEDTENNAILRAVAEAVAEAGPWNASMEMVAKRSGLSKSGLYAHFKNKQDMLDQLFITEFSRLVNFAKAQLETTEVPEAQLYLAIMSIVYYLRSRPEIFIAIDWIKTRRLEFGEEVSALISRTIASIELGVVKELDPHMLLDIAHWMLFLIVNTLAWWPSKPEAGRNIEWAKNTKEIPNESFRFLFRFIAIGLEGLN